jgi:hypothetical protein
VDHTDEIHEHKLLNGRIAIGNREEILQVMQEELCEINARLAILKPKVERDIAESRAAHRKLWGY